MDDKRGAGDRRSDDVAGRARSDRRTGKDRRSDG